VSGNYVDICNLNTFFSGFVGEISKKENDSQIEKDLHRVCFVDLNEKTIDAFKSTWRGEDGTVVNPTYTQGNTSGGPFAKLSMDHWIMDKKPHMFYEGALRSLNFGYFDDSGQMSGFSLTYHKDNPSWWAISIMSNNPLSPQERSLSFFYYNSPYALSHINRSIFLTLA